MKKRILFIEDEPDQLMVTSARLEASGYEVVTVSDGEAGLRRAKEIVPHLILLDVFLPAVNGFEVCTRLKADSKTKGIPVILITASGLKDFEVTAKTVGADAWFRRPCDSAELVKAIERLLHPKENS